MGKSSCIFFNNSFLENLYPFSIETKGEKDYSIVFQVDDKKIAKDLKINFGGLNFAPPKNTTCWCPTFINKEQSDKNIKNKYLVSGSSIDAPTLGIETAISFDPVFRDWTTSDGKMSADWILTAVINSFVPEYGLMCWSKTSQYRSDEKTMLDMTIDDIPYNTVVYSKQAWSYTINNVTISISTDTPLIKKTNNALLIVNQDIIKKIDDNIYPNSNIKYFVLNDLLASNTSLTKKNILFTTSTPNYLVHISDGDVYNYYESSATKSVEALDGLVSRTYLSPVLHDIYRQIYHHLTLKYKKIVDTNSKIPIPFFNRKQGRLFKKLCYHLSTHPQIDRTTVSILQHPDIYDIVNTYINNTNIKLEYQNLYDTLIKISSYFQNLISDDSKYSDPGYIPKRLMEKYGAKLRFTGSAALLKYKHILEQGPHIKATSDIRSLCDKNIKNTTVYNNTKISIGPFSAETLISDTESNFKISSSFSKESSLIPLWDIMKTKLVKEGAPFSVGSDIVLDWDNPESGEGFELVGGGADGEITINLLDAGLLFNKKDSALAGVDINFTWSRISGPDCLRFSNRSLTDIRNNGILIGGSASALRFRISSDESPSIYIKKPGKYTVECSVDTLTGVKTETLKIYVISNGKIKYSRPSNDIPRGKRIINLLSEDKNAIMIPNIKEFIFGKQGIFWPVYSDLSILEPSFFRFPNPLMGGLETKRRVGNIVKPLGSTINKFLIPYDRNKKNSFDNTSLVFTFDCNNTIIELNKIILSNIYSKENPACEPIYRETFDHQIADLELDAVKMLVDPLSGKDIDVPRPTEIGTTELEIKGTTINNTTDIAGTLFGSGANELKFPTYKYSSDIYAPTPEDDSISSTANPVVCYETYPSDDYYNNIKNSGIISMNRGYFHPNSGWINHDYIYEKEPNLLNKTSIIIGDVSKRYCKTFKGLGFNELSNDFIDEKVKVYSSTITIDMDASALDCPTCEGADELLAWDQGQYGKINDHNPNHGYRDLSGRLKSSYKFSDEMIVWPEITNEGPLPSNEYCTGLLDKTAIDAYIEGENVGIRYTLPQAGPIEFPKQKSGLIYNRTAGRTMRDLEIKLNFLNHMNPKELVVWLEVDPPADVVSKVIIPNENENGAEFKQKFGDPLYFAGNRNNAIDTIKNISNIDTQKYLLSLFKMNDNIHSGSGEFELVKNTEFSSVDPKYYLYLLNQDHIDMSSYNHTIKFTNNISAINSNINTGSFATNNIDSSRLKNGIIELVPTISASGYSDNEISQYRTIIQTNHLQQYIKCDLNKFNNLPMFDQYIPPNVKKPPSKNSSAIKLTLKIAVMGESDDGYVYDRILNTDNMLNINNVYTKSISNIPSSSLCSWEAIVSDSKSTLNFEDKDALGQIDYMSKKPRYEGYNFIGKISNNLIPPINLDAPNRSLYDNGKCFYSRESSTAARLFDIPALNLSPLIYMPSWSIVGELANMSSLLDQMNNQARDVYNYFNDLRRVRYAEIFNREIYIPRFSNFGTGRSEKALVSISKDKQIWFKLEAGILRYNNCPILKTKKYTYKHIHYLNEFRHLAMFGLNPIIDARELLQYKAKIIKTIDASIPKYSLDEKQIKDDISNKSSYGLLDLVKERTIEIDNTITDLQNKIKKSTNNNSIAEWNGEVNKLSIIKSDYIQLYDNIGPEGIQIEDIIVIQIPGKKQDELNLSYYTIIKNTNGKMKLEPFSDLYKLLTYNKTLFLHNNLLNIHTYLSDYTLPISSIVDKKELDDKKHKGYITLINNLRAYSIYHKDDVVDIFVPKTKFTDDEKKRLATLQEELTSLIKKLADENKKPEKDRKQETVDILEEQIVNKQNDIFLLQHSKSENTILAKGILGNSNSFQTILIFKDRIQKTSLLVIKPSQNRVIICDTDYVTKDEDKISYNYWSFERGGAILSNAVSSPLDSIFCNGMYGTGSIHNNPKKLYSPEIINYIKDFIEYVDNNRLNNPDFSQSCSIYDSEDKDTQSTLKNIFTYDLYNNTNLLNKYSSFNILKNSTDKDVFNLLNKIMNYDQYNAFFKNSSIKFLIEGDLSRTIKTNQTGKIELDSNIRSEVVYGLKDPNDAKILLDRIKQIPVDINTNQKKIKDIQEAAAKDKNNNTHDTWTKIYNIKNLINGLQSEYNLISFYLERIEIDPKTQLPKNRHILPNISVDVITGDNKSISIQETPNDDQYIINIDAEQNCSIDVDKLPKILIEIRYECLGVVSGGSNLFFYVDPFRFCGSNTFANINNIPRSNEPFIVDDTYVMKQDTAYVTYTMLPKKIKEIQDTYNNPNISWGNTIYTSERSFFLNGGESSRGGIVKATYRYLVPNYADPDRVSAPDGSASSKVKNLFNLSNTTKLYVDFRKINRNLRNVDSLYDKYVPSIDGILTKSLTPPPGGPIDNTLKIWKCYNYRTGGLVELPANFKWMNLLKYMSFYHNYMIDTDMFDINNGLQLIKTRDEMGLIPYDYK